MRIVEYLAAVQREREKYFGQKSFGYVQLDVESGICMQFSRKDEP
jgi:hypothetical protein